MTSQCSKKGRDEVYQILGRGEEDIAGESL
jgi:hypothetical protein